MSPLDDCLHLLEGMEERSACNGQLHDRMLGLLRAEMLIFSWGPGTGPARPLPRLWRALSREAAPAAGSRALRHRAPSPKLRLRSAVAAYSMEGGKRKL